MKVNHMKMDCGCELNFHLWKIVSYNLCDKHYEMREKWKKDAD